MRSEDELLEMVRKRAGELMVRRRHRVALVSAAAAVIVSVLVISVTLPDDDPRDDLVTAGESTTSTTRTEEDPLPNPSTTTSNVTTESSQVPTTTLSTTTEVQTTVPVVTPPTSPEPPAPELPTCTGAGLSLAVSLDRRTYEPGDLIHITVSLANGSATTCQVSTEASAWCAPTANIHHYFEGDENEPEYNGALGIYSRDTCPDQEIVPAGGTVTVGFDAAFETADPGNDQYFLRAGTWNVNANWGDQYGLSAQATFECPEPACRKGPHQ